MKTFKFIGWSKLEELGLEDVEKMNVLEDEEIIVVFGDDIEKFEEAGFEEDNSFNDEDILELVAKNYGGAELLSSFGEVVYDDVDGDNGTLVKKFNINGETYYYVDTPDGIDVVKDLKYLDLPIEVEEKIL